MVGGKEQRCLNLVKQLGLIHNLLLKFFKDDEDKVVLWMTTKNPLIGGVKPVTMVLNGRAGKLLDFIESSLIEGNYP